MHAAAQAAAQRLGALADAQAGAGKVEPRQGVGLVAGQHRLDDHPGVVGEGRRQVGAGQGLAEGAAGHHPALVEQHQVVRQPGHLVGGMAHVDDGYRQLVVQAFEVGQDLQLALEVEGRQRLVHQQQARRGEQRPGDGHALALAAAEAVGAPVEQAADAQQPGDLVEPRLAGAALLAKRQVGPHRQVGEQVGLLEHVAQGPPMGGQEHPLGVVLPHLAAHREIAARGPLQAGHGAQAGGLARAGVAEQGGHALAGQGQVHVEGEAAPVDMEAGADLAHGRLPPSGCGLKVYSASSTTKLKATMPPARRWAWAYSMASTWS